MILMIRYKKLRTKRIGFGILEILAAILIMSSITVSSVPKIGDVFDKPKDVEVLRDLKQYEDAAILLMPTGADFTEENINKSVSEQLKSTSGKSKSTNPYGDEYIINVIDKDRFTVTSNKYKRGELVEKQVLRVERIGGRINAEIIPSVPVTPTTPEESGIPDPPEDVELYYIYEPTGWNSYNLKLNPSFKLAIENNSNYNDWVAGEPLPNPGTEYNGLPVDSMNGTFLGLNATEIDLSFFNTAGISEMDSMFRDSKMNKIDLSSFDTRNLVNMERMFENADAETINISGFETPYLKYMGATFSKSKAKSIDIRHLDTSKVLDMGYLFHLASATNIEVSGISTANVTTMEGMFCGVKDETVDLSSFNTSNVTKMGWMFSESLIKTIDIRHFDTSKVVDFKYAFYLAEADRVNISGINTSSAVNMEGMLYGVKDPLLDITSFNTANVTNMVIMLYGVQMDVIDMSSFSLEKVTEGNLDAIVVGTKATVGYTKTAEDATRLNNLIDKPEGLTFIVKPA